MKKLLRSTRRLALVAVLVVVAVALSASSASAVSKHVFHSSFGGEGAMALVNPTAVAVEEQTGDVWVANSAVNQQQEIEVSKGTTGGTFTLTFKGETTGPITYWPAGGSGGLANAVKRALEALPQFGTFSQDISVAAGEGSGGSAAAVVEFTHGLGYREQPPIGADGAGLQGEGATVQASIVRPASSVADVEKFTPAGQFVLAIGEAVDRTKVEAGAGEAEQNVCTADSGDTCQHGASAGGGGGAFIAPTSLAVDNAPGGEGALYVGDYATGDGSGNVQKFDSSGNLITSWAQGGLLDGSTDPDHHSFAGNTFGQGLTAIGLDGQGNLYVYSSFRFFEFSHGGAFIRTAADLQNNSLRPDVTRFANLANPVGLAVDSDGALYGAMPAGEMVRKWDLLHTDFREAPLILGDIVSPPTDLFHELGIEALHFTGMALDASRNLFVAKKGGEVAVYLGSCAFVRASEPCPVFETFGKGQLSSPGRISLDEGTGTLYVADPAAKDVASFEAVPYLPNASATASPHAPSSESLEGEVDPAGAGNVSGCSFRFVTAKAFDETGYSNLATGGEEECDQSPPFAAKSPVSAEATGLAYGTAYHFQLFAEDSNGKAGSFDQEFTTLPEEPQVLAESATSVHADTATIDTEINPGGGEAEFHTSYHVEYVTQAHFEAEGFANPEESTSQDAGSARTPQSLTAPLAGLKAGTAYRYRVIATNASGKATGQTRSFATLPVAGQLTDSCPNAHVRQQTGAALLLDCRAYELASASDAAGYDVASNLIEGQSFFGGYPQAEGRLLYGVIGGGIPGTNHPTDRGLDPYVATRGESGWSTEYLGVPANDPFSSAPFSSPLLGADASLSTLAFGGPGICSPCFEDGSAGIPVRLPNGELVQGMAGESAEPAGAPDGFVAQSLSANGKHLIFGSTESFAQGGHAATGDVSLYDRNLISGETHVVSNTSEGEDFPEALPCIQGSGKCHTAKKAAESATNGISELAISAEGSHVLVGQKTGEDADHNPSFHLYMTVDDSIRSIDLTPGVIAKAGGPGFQEGVRFAGMSEDGTKVFFTTPDKLLAEDTDESPDLYVAEVSEGAATLHLVSSGEGGPSNSNACSPVANANGEHWNALGATANCGALGIGGGGGVASQNGAAYFLSPEKLNEPGASCGLPCSAEEPVLNQPNLYLATPGEAPRFVATLEASNPLVVDSLKESLTRHTADFQTTPEGSFAALASALPLAGGEEENAGHSQLYRYDASLESLTCASCPPTGEAAAAPAKLAAAGLSLTNDGRLFFTTSAQLVAKDTDGRSDAYEWEPPGTGNCTSQSPSFSPHTGACLSLISAGTSPFDSGLLSATADGKDAFFFTRDSLAPQDENGPTMKIYDARVEGGFPFVLPEKQCQASDECHGASSPSPGPIQTGSEAGTPHNFEARQKRPCRPHFVKRHGACVRPHHHKRRTHKRRAGR